MAGIESLLIFPALIPRPPNSPFYLSYLTPPPWTRGGPLTQGEANHRQVWDNQIPFPSVSLSSSLSFYSCILEEEIQNTQRSLADTLFIVLVGIPGHGEENGVREQIDTRDGAPWRRGKHLAS